RLRVLMAVATVIVATTAFGGVANGPAKKATSLLSFDPSALVQFNGTAVHPDAATVCGSSTETFLTELLHTAPSAVKVNEEWADIVPGGKQVAIDGPVRTTHLGPTD